MEQTGHQAGWRLWILVPASETANAFSIREPLSKTHNCDDSAITLKWSLPFPVLKESDHTLCGVT